MFANSIALLLGNFSFALFIVAIIISMVQWATHQKIPTYEIFFRWLVLLPFGIGGIYGFIMHAFFPELSAAAIGWTDSPFQFEVAIANLAFGLVAILSFKNSWGFRLATVIANSVWLWGDALGHTYQIFANHNYAGGNAGSWYWMDIILPALLIFYLYKIRPRQIVY